MISQPIHFKFLDAFRGLMALMVIVHHSTARLKYETQHDFVLIFRKLTTPLGLSGFFLLSSFLLTYRLYDEMDKTSSQQYKKLALITGKYFIRRFMRIYVDYFVYCTFFCMGSVLSTGI